MEIYYSKANDLLYIRFDPRKQQLRNEDLTEDIVLDIGEGDRIVGIEILDASRHINLATLLPEEFSTSDSPGSVRPRRATPKAARAG